MRIPPATSAAYRVSPPDVTSGLANVCKCKTQTASARAENPINRIKEPVEEPSSYLHKFKWSEANGKWYKQLFDIATTKLSANSGYDYRKHKMLFP